MRPLLLAVLCSAVGGMGVAGVARADCYDDAAQYQKLNPWLLRAIAWNESHNRPDAVHQNANGTIDYGLMQINSSHLPELGRYGVTATELMQGCPNVYVAAWHLRHQIDRYGNTWKAVGAYHSETPALRDRYADQIIGILREWHVLAPAAAAASGAGPATAK